MRKAVTLVVGVLVLALLVSLIVIPVVYTIAYARSVAGVSLQDQFWQGLFAQWLATALGLLAGVPIGFALNSLAARATQARTRSDVGAEKTRIRQFVLGLARQELSAAISRLQLVTAGKPENYLIDAPSLRTALSTPRSSEILSLETAIACGRAVESLTVMREIGSRWLDVQIQARNQPDVPGDITARVLSASAEDALSAVTAALESVEKEMEEDV